MSPDVKIRRGRRQQVLRDQLPEGGFPSGIGVPSAVFVLLSLLLAGFCAVQLRAMNSPAVPEAVAESQQELVGNLARSIGATARQNATDLRTAVSASEPGRAPGDLLAALSQSQPKWRGMAVLDGATGRPVAAVGEPVPVASVRLPVTDATIVPAIQTTGGLRTLVAVAVPGQSGQVLVASDATGIPGAPIDGDLDQGLILTNQASQIVDSRGTVPPADDQVMESLLASAAAAGSSGRTGKFVAEPGPDNGGGELRAPVVSYAAVTADGLSGTVGLSVLSVVRVPAIAPGSPQQGIVPAVALAVVALSGFVVIRVMLIRPVRRLRADALEVAGGNLERRVRRSSLTDVGLIAAAVEHCRAELRGGPPAKKPGLLLMSARIPVLLATLGMLGWSVWVAPGLADSAVEVPDAVISGHRSQVGNTAETIRRIVNDGLSDLQAVAGLNGAKDAGALRPVVEQLAAGQDTYRSVYVVDGTGAVAVSAGRPPLRTTEAPPGDAGVRLQDNTRRVPVLYANVPLPGSGNTLIGEFDIDNMIGLLGRSPGRVRLVDSDLRTLAATDGFVAFEPLPGDAARRHAGDALAGRPAAVVDGESVIVTRPIAGSGAAGNLRWAVVSEKPVEELALPANDVRRGAMLVAFLGGLLAILLFGWHYLLLVRPLRAVAAAAVKLTDGDRTEVIFPQRQDQIGTIACCVEICRQALTDGAGRLGAVRRPQGGATAVTEMLPRPKVEA